MNNLPLVVSGLKIVALAPVTEPVTVSPKVNAEAKLFSSRMIVSLFSNTNLLKIFGFSVSNKTSSCSEIFVICNSALSKNM